MVDRGTIMPARKVAHILKLSAKQQREFVNSFDEVLCDCDGVMWLVSSLLPNTGEGVNALKRDGKRVIFVSNNSVRTDEDYAKRFIVSGMKDFQMVNQLFMLSFELFVCFCVRQSS